MHPNERQDFRKINRFKCNNFSKNVLAIFFFIVFSSAIQVRCKISIVYKWGTESLSFALAHCRWLAHMTQRILVCCGCFPARSANPNAN